MARRSGGTSASGPGLERAERLDVGRPARALLVDDAEGDELVPEVGVVGAEAEAAGLGVGDVAGLLDEVAQPVQLGPVEPEERAGLEQHDVVAPGERAEERLEGHLLAVDLDGDPQVEPVAGISLLAPLAGAEPHDRSRRDLLVGRDVAVDLDRDVLVGLEQGQGVGDEPGGGKTGEHDARHEVGVAAEVRRAARRAPSAATSQPAPRRTRRRGRGRRRCRSGPS